MGTAPHSSRSRHRKPSPKRSQVQGITYRLLNLWCAAHPPLVSMGFSLIIITVTGVTGWPGQGWASWLHRSVQLSEKEIPCSSLLFLRHLTTSGADGVETCFCCSRLPILQFGPHWHRPARTFETWSLTTTQAQKAPIHSSINNSACGTTVTLRCWHRSVFRIPLPREICAVFAYHVLHLG